MKLRRRTPLVAGPAGPRPVAAPDAPAPGGPVVPRSPPRPGRALVALTTRRRQRREAFDLVPGPSPSGCPTLARLELEARTILDRLQRLDASDGAGTRWSAEGVEGVLEVLADFHRRLELLVQLDHDPSALPEVLATRRWIAQAQLVVVGRLTDLCGD